MKCAGVGPGNRMEQSGYLTADFTQKSCSAVIGSIVANTAGNQKCCNFPDIREDSFKRFCNLQLPDHRFADYHPSVQPC
ncbi:hypothetical protein PHMEG_00012267 [Phytophthora megakarya]|uniref:Uncharacterized protein n=1 Tax=Phytophthora megakarya TaxID=4795 RepID=A0A225W965_9STRA|nr:hypothetical protein PHMEG_00012267 [Phytophthora megakarya]